MTQTARRVEGVPPFVSTPTNIRTFLLVVLVAGVGLGITAPFTAVLVTALNGSGAEASLVVSSMGLSLLVCDALVPRLIPRLDPRVLVSGALTVFGIGSALTAYATTWELVGLARVVQGFGTALFMSGGMYLALALGRHRDAAGAIGSFNAAWFGGVASGPLGGGLIASLRPGEEGLHLLFLVCAGINFAGAVFGWFLVPRVPVETPSSWREVRSLVGPPRGIRLSRRIWGVLVLVGVGQTVRSAMALTLVPLLAAETDLDWMGIGIVLAFLSCTDVVTMQVSAGWSTRWGRFPVLAWSLAIGAVAMALYAALPATPVLIGALAFALGITVGITWVVPAAMVVDLVPVEEHAVTAYRIASDVGMLGGGLLVSAALIPLSISATFGCCAALLVASLLLARAVGETRSVHITTGGPHAVPVP